jgi:hypothetical protein
MRDHIAVSLERLLELQGASAPRTAAAAD